jgi:hypothetical protein
MADGSGSSQRGPVATSLTLIFLTLLIIYVGKICLRAPEYRYVEVCYLPHKVAHWFWVDAWGSFVPDDNASYIKHSRDLTTFFISCTQQTAGWDWLRTIGPNQ